MCQETSFSCYSLARLPYFGDNPVIGLPERSDAFFSEAHDRGQSIDDYEKDELKKTAGYPLQ